MASTLLYRHNSPIPALSSCVWMASTLLYRHGNFLSLRYPLVYGWLRPSCIGMATSYPCIILLCMDTFDPLVQASSPYPCTILLCRHGHPYLCTTLLYWDAGLGDRFFTGTGDRYRASSHEIDLQAFDHRILHATLSRSSQLIKSGSR